MIYLTLDERAQILLDAAREAYPHMCECPSLGVVAQERLERERNAPHPRSGGSRRVPCRFCGSPVDHTDTSRHEVAQHGACYDAAEASKK